MKLHLFARQLGSLPYVRIALLMLMVFMLMISSASATTAPTDFTKASSHTMEPVVTPMAAPGDPFGFWFVTNSQGELVGGQQMADAGAKWAQVALSWRRLEPSEGSYNWGQADARIGAVTSHGLQPIVFISDNPFWAAETGCGPIREEKLPAFASFLTALAGRYSNVQYWQLYNEPDNGNAIDYAWLGGCWGRTNPKHAEGAGGEAYANMLSYAYPAIKAGNGNAQVLLGALAYDNWYNPTTNPNGPFDSLFLDEMMLAGGGSYFDVGNFHYFPAWSWAWDTQDRYTSGIYGKANYLRNQLGRLASQSNTAAKPLIVTEVGMPVDEVTSASSRRVHPNRVARPGDVSYSAEDVALYLIQAHARAMYFGLPIVLWFEAVDEPGLAHYGLLRSDLSPRTTYDAYKTMTAELSGATSVTARRDLPEYFEAYDFEVDGVVKTLQWTLDGGKHNQACPVDPGGMVRVIESSGAERVIIDGSIQDLDGIVNGSVSISVSSVPKYCEPVTTTATFLPYALMTAQ